MFTILWIYVEESEKEWGLKETRNNKNRWGENKSFKIEVFLSSVLTLTLLDVGVELVQRSDGDLPDLRVEQELHQRGGDVLTGRHAGRLRNFTLKRQKTSDSKLYIKKLKSSVQHKHKNLIVYHSKHKEM